jgi:regulator of protease activity HflC (stomatin/prohibitin superfamily)
MRNREEIRMRLRSELNKELNGWGITIESIEITEAKIKSKTLFNDMQA